MGYYDFSDLAIEDIEEICGFIAETNASFAGQLFDEIRKKSKLVADFPNMGKNYDDVDINLRGFIVYDYVVFYYPVQDGIRIARIIYGKRELKLLFEEFKE